MKTETLLTDDVRMDIEHELSTFLLMVCLIMAILIALWGFACMIGALVTNSPADLVTGLLHAMTGS